MSFDSRAGENVDSPAVFIYKLVVWRGPVKPIPQIHSAPSPMPRKTNRLSTKSAIIRTIWGEYRIDLWTSRIPFSEDRFLDKSCFR